jgi:hypothetical protein
MRRIHMLACCLLVAACAPNPQTLESVARSESARLAPPTRKLSTFADYQLKPMVLSPAVQTEDGKVKIAAQLEAEFNARVQPLIDKWRAAPADGRTGTLVIEPHLASLKVVSGGARFWAGAFAGESSIDMDLWLTDASTGEQVAKVRIAQSADAMTGAWSIGQSDDNLLTYVSSIACQYLEDSY